MVASAVVRQALGGLAVCLSAACDLAGSREQVFVHEHMAALPGVEVVHASCSTALVFADTQVCATVGMSEGAVLRFLDLGYQSFGPAPSRVRVAAAGGREPVVVSCHLRTDFADIGRSARFGHHFSPPIDGVADALRRRREVIEELEFWPQCPQFWELAGEQGTTYRYCAHAAGAAAEPPPRPCGQSLDSAK